MPELVGEFYFTMQERNSQQGLPAGWYFACPVCGPDKGAWGPFDTQAIAEDAADTHNKGQLAENNETHAAGTYQTTGV